MPTDLGKESTSHFDGAKKQRLRELDVLRGIAVIAVLCCHYLSICHVEASRIDFEFALGAYGAHLFFIISGFVIFMTLERCKQPGDFLFSRVTRLYPIYWIGVLLSTTVMLLAASKFRHAPPSLVELIGNLTMLQSFMKIPNIEDSYWTLAVELKFYALMFGLLLVRKLDRIEAFVGVWLGAVIAFRISSPMGLPAVLGTPLIVDFAHLFAAGIMLYRIRNQGHTWFRNGIVLSAVPMQGWIGGIESAIVISGFVLVFYLFNFGLLKWIINRPLSFLGDISYPLYLIHGAVGIATIQLLNEWCEPPVIILFLVPTVASIGIATLLTYKIEKPLLTILRRWYKDSKPSRTFRLDFGHRHGLHSSLRLPLS